MVNRFQRAVPNQTRLPTLYVPHGGGPCFFMEWPPPLTHAWDSLAHFLRSLTSTLVTRPRAMLVISAHWEAETATVTTRRDPPLIFDYSGFPPETYQLRYDAPGSPELAKRVRELLEGAGIASAEDSARGLDHGVFVPFKLIEPEADVPIVALSLVAGLDASTHLSIGEALAPLRDEGVLIVGSGMSYHNMREFLSANEAAGSTTFESWLSESVVADVALRNERLRDWRLAPDARVAHPREEHLIPLMVAAGAAGDDLGTRVFNDRILGASISGYRFG